MTTTTKPKLTMLELLETEPLAAAPPDLRPVLLSIDRRLTQESHYVGGAQLTPKQAAEAEARAEFRAEQAAAGTTPHPNAVQVIKGITPDVALSLSYALIDPAAPILANPEVRDGYEAAVPIVNELARAARIPKPYLLKHLRNVIVQATGRTPERVFSDASHGVLSGLGDFNQTGSTVTGLLNAVGGLVSAFRKPPPPPTVINYQYPAQPAQVNPNAQQPGGGGMSTTTMTALAVGGVVIVLGGLAVAMRGRK